MGDALGLFVDGCAIGRDEGANRRIDLVVELEDGIVGGDNGYRDGSASPLSGTNFLINCGPSRLTVWIVVQR